MDGSPLTDKVKSEINLLKRTVNILNIIEREEPIGITKLSEKLDIPEHKVRYSLRMLQKESIIEPTHQGAHLTEKNQEFKNHLIELLIDLDETIDKLKNEISD
ncbi:MAG: winged helix-turn-helix transcriptional regulator [Thermoplasmatota archaeon]